MSGDEENSSTDHAGVRFPPPLIFLIPLLAGLAVDSSWIAGGLASTAWMVAGGIFSLVGLVLMIASAPRHRRAGTNIEPWKPTTAIIDDGIYGYSRNPIYLAMALVYTGLALAASSIAALVLLVPCLIVIRLYVIGREEVYLESKFGEAYLQYKARVRRWI
ncbi:isoprenylcysteine carboxylmethyltransferase family protein [Pelagibius sp. Alg239-R121]|uniref:methyltransferase family protein n=1 Tax=Pelagibius sp. Alg239-R121 TaxID=2993448 RepID=UPI0024A69108|nr:isoprenylcysteine carboxylmethyltransferase family protein [Pelagibius sp. Alg239-R121]